MNPKNRLLWCKRQGRLAHEGKLGAEQVCGQMDAAGRFSSALVSERRRLQEDRGGSRVQLSLHRDFSCLLAN